MSPAPVLAAGVPRHRVLRRGPLALRLRRRELRVLAVLAVLVLAAAVLALMLGDIRLGAGEVLGALLGRADAATTTIVRDWRLPRTLAALVFGAALALSGAVFQTLTRNPLASPDIIGFSAGAHTGALVVILLLGGGYLQVAGGAVGGGLATAALIYLLAHRRGMQGFRLIIVGIAVSAMLASLNAYLMLTARLELAMTAAVWGAGSLGGVDAAALRGGAAGILVGVLLLALVAPALAELDLGEELAIGHGVAVPRVWALSAISGVALTAVVTAACGPIAFVSLVCPQIARRLCGGDTVPLLPTALLGSCLLLLADVVAQHALPNPVPVGLVTVVLGGGYLIHLIVRENRRRP